MARSSYVYVVISDGKPVAGFTVKKELIAWLKRSELDGPSVWRIRDAPYGPHVRDAHEYDLTELLSD